MQVMCPEAPDAWAGVQTHTSLALKHVSFFSRWMVVVVVVG